MNLIILNIKKQEENDSAIIDKILTNYFHMVSALLSFNIAFPKYLYSLFKLIKDLAPRIDTILSFDCFVEDTKIGIIQSSEYLSRAFFQCILPLVFGLAFVGIFGLVKLMSRKSKFKTNIAISTFTITYFFYPGLTEKIIGLFKCVTIEESKRFYLDFEIVCWKEVHKQFVFSFGVPMLIVWIIGLPTIGIIFLAFNRKKVDEPAFKKYYQILYQGLKPTRFYWEFVNTFRKVFILSINVVIS